MTFIDLCAGIGGFRLGFEMAGHKCIGFSEIDKYAVKSYRAMYDTEGEWYASDITKLNSTDIPYAEMWTFGFPCQDISAAGKKVGLAGERSSIFYNIINLLKDKSINERPQWLLIENVKNLISINQGKDFQTVLDELNACGYNVSYKLLNSKDFNVPQNRERVYFVCSKKGIDNKPFVFPEKKELKLKLKHLLEKNVPSKYYVSEMIQKRFVLKDTTLSKNIIGSTAPSFRTIGQRDGVYGEHSIVGAILATDYKQPKQILESNKLQLVGLIGDKNSQGNRVYNPEGISCTLTGQSGGMGGKTGLYLTDYRIRKLTPLECFRIQGFPDEYYKRAAAVNSDTQLYKQAGNSVTVNVVYEIAEMLIPSENRKAA